MPERHQFSRHPFRQRKHFRDFEITENTMMRFTAIVLKQAEEQEHVADPNALPLQMRLRRAALAEQASTIGKEHRIMVAKVFSAELAAAGLSDICAQPQRAVTGLRSRTRRDRQADRPPSDNWRRPTARRAIETLPTEDDPQS